MCLIPLFSYHRARWSVVITEFLATIPAYDNCAHTDEGCYCCSGCSCYELLEDWTDSCNDAAAFLDHRTIWLTVMNELPAFALQRRRTMPIVVDQSRYSTVAVDRCRHYPCHHLVDNCYRHLMQWNEQLHYFHL